MYIIGIPELIFFPARWAYRFSTSWCSILTRASGGKMEGVFFLFSMRRFCGGNSKGGKASGEEERRRELTVVVVVVVVVVVLTE